MSADIFEIPKIREKTRQGLLSNITFLLSILIAGALLPLSFAPYNLWPLAILSPAYLLWVWTEPQYHLNLNFNFKFFRKHFHSEPRKALLTGFIYGIGMFGLGVSWVFVSIHRFGNTEVPLAIFLTALMVMILSLLPAVQGYLLKRFFKGNLTAFCLLGFPCAWVIFEWIRSIYLSGFPWLFLGYTQLNTALRGFAPIGSVYAVSMAVVLTSGAVVLLLRKNLALKNKIIAAMLMLGIWGLGAGLVHQNWTAIQPKEYTVSLVQGNILPIDKFTQADPIQAARKTYLALSENHWGSDFVIWPENAVAYPLPLVESFIQELNTIAKAHKSTLITGLQTVIDNRDYYNSLIAIGEGEGIYHKRHLVPFGDYLPFDGFLRGLIAFFDIPMSSFVAGPLKQDLLKAGDLSIAPLICYEIAFPELLRETIQEANLVVTLSEDGWFGDSFGPHQHLEIARMRALETGRYVLRATTSGISAIISPKGELLSTSAQFQAMVLKGTFQAVIGETPWMKYGLLPLMIILLLGFLLPGRIKIKDPA